MALLQYDPLYGFNQLRREINRLLDQNVPNGEDGGMVYARDWAPAVDIREEEDRYVVYADVPGVDPQSIEITMENGVLTLAGERKLESREEADQFRRVERVRGKFLRRFTLPQTTDTDRIAARSFHGTLEITIPKAQQALSRRIPVQTQ